MLSRKIVVLTPVRNEAWILDRFLAATSTFADLIVILDQCSTDGSGEIVSRYEKAIAIDNDNVAYDECSRQQLLIEKAREIAGAGCILLAIDADEILNADAARSPGWNALLEAEPGTVLCFDKPTFTGGFGQAIRYPKGFPLGYVDDGATHTASMIHSTRVPTSAESPRLFVPGVVFMHYALMRPKAQANKARMYAMIENVHGTKGLLRRRRQYAYNRSYLEEGPLEACPDSWFEGWEAMGIDVRNIQDCESTWHDAACLKMLQEYGAQRFINDCIWDKDWNAVAEAELSISSGIASRLTKPSALRESTLRVADIAFDVGLRGKQALRNVLASVSGNRR